MCECGSNFNRKVYHRNKNSTTFCYVCYNIKTHPKNRYENSDYKFCEVKEVQEWKLEFMAEAIFRNFTQDIDNRRKLTNRLMKGVKIDEHPEKKIKQRVDKLNQ